MVSSYLVPDATAREDGRGPEVLLGPAQGRPLAITLEITRVLEQQSLEMSIWGSRDGDEWRALASFPPKCYCGTYTALVNLSSNPEVRFLRAQWKMSRWLEGRQRPLFDFYVRWEMARARVAGAA